MVVFTTAWKVSKYEVFSGPLFPVFRLNTEIYSVNLRIQPIYGKIRTRKNSVFAHYSHSVLLKINLALRLFLPNEMTMTNVTKVDGKILFKDCIKACTTSTFTGR